VNVCEIVIIVINLFVLSDKQAGAKQPKDPVGLKRTPSARSNPHSPDSANGDIGKVFCK
jgi:hypothetical protein